MIMSTMILDSLDNVGSKKGPSRRKVFVEHSFVKLLLHPKFQEALYLLFEGSRAPIFAQRWVMDDVTPILGLHCQRETQI